MVSYVIYFHALFTHEVQHASYRGVNKKILQKPCAFVDFVPLHHFIGHAEMFKIYMHPIKMNEVSPKFIN